MSTKLDSSDEPTALLRERDGLEQQLANQRRQFDDASDSVIAATRRRLNDTKEQCETAARR